MGEIGPQPLSRRVPGATAMAKAQVRASPPKIPDSVLERLRAEVTAARATTADQQSADPALQPAESPVAEPADREPERRSKVVPLPKRSKSKRRSREAKAAASAALPEVVALPTRQKIA